MDSTIVHQQRFSVGRALKRYSKFLIVGTVNAGVDLGVLNILIALAPAKSAATLTFYNTIAVVLAIVTSYILNRRFTFSDLSTGSTRERILFFMQGVVNVFLNDLTMVGLSTYLLNHKSLSLFLGSNVGKALAMLVSSTASYLFMRYLVFRKSHVGE